MNQDLISRLLSNVLTMNVLFVQDLDTDSRRLENLYCFHKDLQPLYTAEGFQTALAAVQPDIFYLVEDHLHVCSLFFSFQGTVFVIGPYVSAELNESELSSILSKLHLTQTSMEAIRIYHAAFPLYGQAYVTRICQGILSAFQPDLPAYSVRNLRGFYTDRTEDANIPSEEPFLNIYANYAKENYLMKMIESGRTEDALRAFTNLLSLKSSSQNLVSLSANMAIYHNPLVVDAILRTLIRKAAEAGGLSVVTIHRLTQENIQRSSAHGINLQHTHLYDLIRDLTEGVRLTHQKTQGYSKETKQAVEYLELRFSQQIHMQDILDELNCSRTHLSDVFKRDTGLTIGQYIARLRCEKAAELLAETQIPVQNISMLVGYPDSNYFVKVFRAQTGDTPSDYRKKTQGT